MKNFKFIPGIFKSPFDARDWKVRMLQSVGDEDNLPDELDLRKDNQSVRNQGSQGSCAAMAAAAMKEFQEKKDYGLNEWLAPQFIYNLRSNYPEEGMYSRDLLKILQNKGVPKETTYPYGKIESGDKIKENVLTEAELHKIKNYAAIETITEFKKASYTNGACLIAVPVYNYTGRMWKQNPGESFLGGHMMETAGYCKDGIFIKNSWGSWDIDGYTLFPWEDWGIQWEIWTAVDEKTPQPIPPQPGKKIKWYWWVIGAVIIVTGIIIKVFLVS